MGDPNIQDQALFMRRLQEHSQESAEKCSELHAELVTARLEREDLRQQLVELRRDTVSRAEFQAMAELLHAAGNVFVAVWDQVRVAAVQSVVED